MIFELRHYLAKPGKEAALRDRFEKLTFPLLAELGYAVSSTWQERGTPASLWYVMRWESAAAREAAWQSFKTLPQWVAIKDETERDGPLVERIDSYVLEAWVSFDGVGESK